MSGVRPIEVIVYASLSEQAPTVILYDHFCMAELLPTTCEIPEFSYQTWCNNGIRTPLKPLPHGQNHLQYTLVRGHLSQR